MKKVFVKSVTSLLLVMLFSFVGICYAEENKRVEVIGAVYEVTENVLDQDLGYGIHHIKDKAMSSKNSSGLFPQSVNVLEIPAREDVRIVNWTQSNMSGWSKATVRAMANDFESKNPGWVVVAAVNGDFFDINGTNKALPYQTGGVTVSDGEVYRPFTNDQTIGIKNGTGTDRLLAEKTFEVSGHMLNIYNELDEVIYSQEVKYFNEQPADGEIAIWYSYKDSTGLIQKVTLPGTNSYFVKTPNRILAMTTSNVYAKGTIFESNQEVEMHYGQFGIQTNKQDIQALLSEGVKIRVQQNVIGDYAEYDNITGGGVCLVRNGEAIATNNMDTHPRTVIGEKEDGTLVFMTVDGRQDNRDMHGMAYNELSATMLYYGCTEAYNLDGGGSTTMLIRNEFGDFDVLNSPSDGSERHDSNSLLVVVPELYLSIKNVADTNVTIDYIAPTKDVIISNINITINNETRKVDSFPYVWEGLTPTTSYKIDASYDLQYKSSKETKSIKSISIKTGVQKPFIESAYYFEYEDKVVLNYKISNAANITCLNTLTSGDYIFNLARLEGRVVINKSDVDLENMFITLGYNLKSSVSEYTEEEIQIQKLNLKFENGMLDPTYLQNSFEYTDKLPTPSLGEHIFNGWIYNDEVVDSFSQITEYNQDEIKALFNPLGGKNDKKGCKKSNGELVVSLFASVSMVALVLKKKHY